jgi:hypothetical protein
MKQKTSVEERGRGLSTLLEARGGGRQAVRERSRRPVVDSIKDSQVEEGTRRGTGLMKEGEGRCNGSATHAHERTVGSGARRELTRWHGSYFLVSGGRG